MLQSKTQTAETRLTKPSVFFASFPTEIGKRSYEKCQAVTDPTGSTDPRTPRVGHTNKTPLGEIFLKNQGLSPMDELRSLGDLCLKNQELSR